MSICLILALLVAAVYAAVFTFRILRGRRVARLLALSRATAGDAVGSIGITVIVAAPRTVDDIAQPAGMEYPRMEVIAVVDSQRDREIFEALKTRYSLIGVNYARANALPPQPVRGLYRSRRRCYRRVAMVDVQSDSPPHMCDAAAAVAVYDYVAVVPAGAKLHERAVDRMAAEAAMHPACTVAEAVVSVGSPVAMTALETLVARGGFSGGMAGQGTQVSGRRLRIDEPLAWPRRRQMSRPFAAALLLSAVAAAAAADTAFIMNSWAMGVVAATVAAVWLAAVAVAGLVMSDTDILAATETLLYNFYNNLAFVYRDCNKILLSLLTKKT